MLSALTRRGFLGVAGAAAVSLRLPSLGAAPAILRRRTARAAAVSSANGLRAVSRAMELMLQGTDTLDAAIEGVKIQELDPNDNSVGYGGSPTRTGWCSSTPRACTARPGAPARSPHSRGSRRRARSRSW